MSTEITLYDSPTNNGLYDDDVFHAPAQPLSLIETLVSQYDQRKRYMKQVSDVMNSEQASMVLWYFCKNSDQRDNRNTSLTPEYLFNFEESVAYLRADFWDQALRLTDVFELMPQKRLTDWTNMIQNPKGSLKHRMKRHHVEETEVEWDIPPLPEFTYESVTSTIREQLSMRAQYVAERVDGIFRGLSGSHVTNIPEGFSKRMIISQIYPSGYSFNYPKMGLIHDLSNVICKFMKRTDVTRASTERFLRFAAKRRGTWVEADGGALRMKLFLNGNCHFEIHPEMSLRLNEILATLYPLAIPSQFRAKTPKVKPSKDFGYLQRPISSAICDALAGCEEGYEFVDNPNEWQYKKSKVKIKNSVQFSIRNMASQVKIQTEYVLKMLGGKKLERKDVFVFDYPEPLNIIHQVAIMGVLPDQVSHQYYPTPKTVASMVHEMLGEIKGTDKILEPSAGQGGLISGEYYQKYLPQTTCVEISKLHCDILEQYYFIENIINKDFVEWAVKQISQTFDKVLMNPPFSEGRWQMHLEHASRLCKETLVAVLPSSAITNETLQKKYGNDFKISFSEPISGEFDNVSIDVCILKLERLQQQ